MYVNVEKLVLLLNKYDPYEETIYVGVQAHVPGWEVSMLLTSIDASIFID